MFYDLITAIFMPNYLYMEVILNAKFNRGIGLY